MKTYRVAVLGCRNRGTQAALGYHHHPRTEVVGVCDLVAERRDTLGDLLDVSARFDDLHQMIEATKPDIVAVPTGTEFHYELCMQVLEHAPINIDVEKPVTVDLVQADTLLARAEQSGSHIAVHHQGRSGPAMRAVTKAIAAGRIGEPRYLEASGKGYYGGYGLMNIGTHMINAMLEIAGQVQRVTASAVTGGHPIRPEDVVPSPSGMGTIAGEHITALLEFDSGMLATLKHHRFPTVDSTATGILIHGATGRMHWATATAALLATPHEKPGVTDTPWQPLELEQPAAIGDSEATEYFFVDDYVNALDGGGEHRCSGQAGRHVLEVIMAIFESAATGRAVAVPQTERDEHPLLRWRRAAGDAGSLPEMPRPYLDWLAVEDQRLGRTAAAAPAAG